MTMSGSSNDDRDRDRSRDPVRAFLLACEAADHAALIAILDAGATIVVDGGGRVRAPSTPVSGSEPVGRVILDLVGRIPLMVISEKSVNGGRGLVARSNGCVVGVATLGIRSHRIHQLWVVVNPDKLRSWNTSGLARDGH